MLHILLTILAVIGKILLGILGFIFLLLLLILLVPIRYKGSFRKQEKEMEAKASVSWLLRFLQVQVSWAEKKLSFEVRILGIPLLRLLNWIKARKKGSDKKKTGRKGKEKPSEPGATEAPETNTEAVHAGAEDLQMSAVTIQEDAETGLLSETETEEEKSEVAEGTGAEENGPDLSEDTPADPADQVEKVSLFKKIAAAIEKILAIPKKVSDAVKNIVGKIKGIFSKLEDLKNKATWILDLLRTDMFKEVFNCVKKELLAMIRHILPRKLWGELEYGLGDPATTGEILVGLAAVYPVLPKKLVICPNFEEQILNGELALKGRIQLVVLLFHGVRVILNKQVRRLIKKVRHKEA